jgi:hypothetical protein
MTVAVGPIVPSILSQGGAGRKCQGNHIWRIFTRYLGLMALAFDCHGQQIPLTTLTPGCTQPPGMHAALSQGARAACMPVAYCGAYRLLPPGEGGMLPSGRYADARRADEGNPDLAPALDPRKVSAIGQGWRGPIPFQEETSPPDPDLLGFSCGAGGEGFRGRQ